MTSSEQYDDFRTVWQVSEYNLLKKKERRRKKKPKTEKKNTSWTLRERSCFGPVAPTVAVVHHTDSGLISLRFKRLVRQKSWLTDNGPSGLTVTWWGCCGLCPWHKSTELAHSFYSLLVPVSVFMTLSTVFHFINPPDNSVLPHSVLPDLFLPYWSFQLYISLWKST